MMDQLLRGLEDCAAAYLDDLVIYNLTWTEHLTSLRKVLERLRTAGLTAKPSKCYFAMKEVVHLPRAHRRKWTSSTGNREASGS